MPVHIPVHGCRGKSEESGVVVYGVQNSVCRCRCRQAGRNNGSTRKDRCGVGGNGVVCMNSRHAVQSPVVVGKSGVQHNEQHIHQYLRERVGQAGR